MSFLVPDTKIFTPADIAAIIAEATRHDAPACADVHRRGAEKIAFLRHGRQVASLIEKKANERPARDMKSRRLWREREVRRRLSQSASATA